MIFGEVSMLDSTVIEHLHSQLGKVKANPEINVWIEDRSCRKSPKKMMLTPPKFYLRIGFDFSELRMKMSEIRYPHRVLRRRCHPSICAFGNGREEQRMGLPSPASFVVSG